MLLGHLHKAEARWAGRQALLVFAVKLPNAVGTLTRPVRDMESRSQGPGVRHQAMFRGERGKACPRECAARAGPGRLWSEQGQAGEEAPWAGHPQGHRDLAGVRHTGAGETTSNRPEDNEGRKELHLSVEFLLSSLTLKSLHFQVECGIC